MERFLEDADHFGGALTEGERNKLIIENTKLVTHIAAGLLRRKKEIPFEDLVAEGMLGLVQAARKFDPGRGVKFSTFTWPWIEGAIKRLIERWQRFEQLDGASEEDDRLIHQWQAWCTNGASDEDERLIHQWQAWPVFSESWTSLPATPDEILEIYGEFSDEKAAIKVALIALSPRDRRMLEAHLLGEPRFGLGVIARFHTVSYRTTVTSVYDAVKKMRAIVEIITNRKSPGVGRMAA